MTSPNLTGKLHRWALTLLEFDLMWNIGEHENSVRRSIQSACGSDGTGSDREKETIEATDRGSWCRLHYGGATIGAQTDIRSEESESMVTVEQLQDTAAALAVLRQPGSDGEQQLPDLKRINHAEMVSRLGTSCRARRARVRAPPSGVLRTPSRLDKLRLMPQGRSRR